MPLHRDSPLAHAVPAIGTLILLGGLQFAAGSALADEAVNIVTFACVGDKTIHAVFYSDEVHLDLSDGRSMNLPQTMSGSGIRYANKDESFVFWSKGNTAFVTEGADEKETFSDCILLSDLPGTGDWTSFASPAFGFSVRYPRGYTVDPAYRYQALGPGKEISGVSFTIPEAMTKGTNLGSDTRVSVETLPKAESCTAGPFLSSVMGKVRKVKEGGVEYSVAELDDAGAGNLFEEHVYALVGTSPCLAVRYFIHSANIGNFDPGTVRAFDKPALLRPFDKIRKSLVIGR
jgi:membrane-bound inhibitor of C-type lysozyme